jgi:hypothetical protein
VIGDRWTLLIETLSTKGKGAWGYRVPDDAADHTLLRSLCRETLAFENHYLACYRAYLLALPRQGDEASVRFAIERLGTVLYPDAEVSDEHLAVTVSGHPALRASARETLRRIEEAKRRVKHSRYRLPDHSLSIVDHFPLIIQHSARFVSRSSLLP